MAELQSEKGTYALTLSLARETRFARVGTFGAVTLPRGFYVYVGSAFGPGGVKGRIDHHLRHATRPHWHLDYVRPTMAVLEAWITYDTDRRECQWARLVDFALDGHAIVPGMGSADCDRCRAHFYYFPRRRTFRSFRQVVSRAIQDHSPIERVVFQRSYSGAR
jgi:Uri superfamily endonuclease